jgi:hypothetical protein
MKRFLEGVDRYRYEREKDVWEERENILLIK